MKKIVMTVLALIIALPVQGRVKKNNKKAAINLFMYIVFIALSCHEW